MTAEEQENGVDDLSPAVESEAPPATQPTEIDQDSGKSLLTLKVLIPFLLLLVLILGAYFRFTGLDWDNTYHLHPDERFLTDVASLLHSTNPITYLKTSESPLNPYNVGRTFFVYGNFPMTATRLVAEGVDSVCQSLPDLCERSYVFYDGIHLVGRSLSGLADLVSILFIFLIGRRLYDWRAGILGALLLAAAVLPIQQSHFFTMDNWAAALAVITMYGAVRVSENDSKYRWWAFFGVLLGLTVASRINLAPLAVMAGIAGFVWLARRAIDHSPEPGWRFLLTTKGGQDFQHVVLGIAIAAILSIIVFRLAQPYAFADSQIVKEVVSAETGQPPGLIETIIKSVFSFNPQWRANMTEIQNLQSPEASFPPALQWTDRLPIVFPYLNIVLWGMGLTAGIAATFGFFWALWRIIKARPDWTSHLLIVSWVGLYFIFMSTRWVKSIRYFLPIYPFLLLLAGWALVELWNRAGRSKAKKSMAAFVALVVIIPSLLWANAFVDTYRQSVTRVQASQWMFENVPTGATLLYESAGESRQLQLPLRHFEFIQDSIPLFITFNMPETGDVTGIRFNYLSDPDSALGSDSGETLNVSLLDGSNNTALVEKELSLQLGDQRQSALLNWSGVPVAQGSVYTLLAEIGPGGPIRAGTSVIANEHWDDSLPVRYEGQDPFGGFYDGTGDGQIQITHPDSEEKRQSFYRWLEESDYIVLSSQRAAWSLPRLPFTFPMTIRYYEALFGGELGFDLVNEFHSDTHVGPLFVSDVGGAVNWGAPPEIGWPPPGIMAAEEAFSVYDHPPVWIFEKSDHYSPELVRDILGPVDLRDVIVMSPGEATRAPNGLLLDESDRAIQEANGTFNDLFLTDGLLARYPGLAAVVWWLVVILLGWLFFPITFIVFRGLPDRGYPLARILSLLLISYITWLLASLKILSHSRSTIILVILVMLAACLAIAISQKRELLGFVRKNLRLIGLIEILGIGLFLLFILIRLGNPDVWDVIWGGEKPMDLSYLNAVLKSTYFPPYDPWFSGGYINYYYYGFVYVGSLIKLLQIVPTIAYNLILPMLASFTGLAAFSIAFNIITKNVGHQANKVDDADGLNVPTARLLPNRQALFGGFVAAVLILLLGNLAEITVVFNAWYKAGELSTATGITPIDALLRTVDGALDLSLTDEVAPIYPGDWFWNASRTINADPGEVQPITEFPFFTFLYGDLHAHMVALPLTLLALGWAVSIVLQHLGQGTDPEKVLPVWQRAMQLLIGALAIGVLWATNTWDYPTYLFLGVLAIVYGVYLQRKRWGWGTVAQGLFQATLLIVVSFLLFLPFTANYGRGYSSFRFWPGSYTQLGNYLLIYGLFLFLIITHLVVEFRLWTKSWSQKSLEYWERFAIPVLLGLVLYTAMLIVLLSKGYWIAPVALLLSTLAGLLAIRPGLPLVRRIPLVMISSALALTLLVEIIVLDGDIGRMNTVFKFYMQVWVLLSVAAGIVIVWDWPSVSARPTVRRVWRVALIILLFLAALYPLLATKAKWDTRMSDQAPTTLDGMAFLQTTTYTDIANDGTGRLIDLNQDYLAIQWMQRNIEGSPVIAEAHSDNPYRAAANRVSMYTGLPSIIGWDWHQRQQRAVLPGSIVSDRIFDVNTLFNTPDIPQAMGILDKYGVSYIYVGPLEWTYYNSLGLLKFQQMVRDGFIRDVYNENGVTIYEVLDQTDATTALLTTTRNQ